MDDRKRVLIQLHVIICMLLFIQGVLVYIARIADGPVNSILDNTTICGVLTVFQVMLCIAMVAVSWRYALGASLMFSGTALAACFYTIIINGDSGSVPGAVTIAAGIVLMFFLRSQLQSKEYAANYDSLTEIPNRRFFLQELDRRVDKKTPFYLMYFDLDSFKLANDKYGHDIGDVILKETAQFWRENLRSEDFIARVGGDEFCAIIPQKGISDIDSFIAKFTEELTTTRVKGVTNREINLIDVSIGVVRFPQDSKTADDLLKNVDYAMYEAKKKPDNYCSYNNKLKKQIEHISEVEEIVKSALSKNNFYMVYQPQYSVNDKTLRGFEALIRLRDDEGNRVPPSDFIPVIEKTGIILDVDDYVIRNTIKQFKEVIDINPNIVVSINVSANHICDSKFASFVGGVLKENKFPSHNLEIEITEYSYVTSKELAVTTISELKHMGVKIALDDFGTGYSSLSMFSSVPLDIIKIDKSLIDDIIDDKDKKLLVEQIINIGHMFNCKVLSEGIENDQQLEALRSFDCDYIQGYYWGKPVDIESAKEVAAI